VGTRPPRRRTCGDRIRSRSPGSRLGERGSGVPIDASRPDRHRRDGPIPALPVGNVDPVGQDGGSAAGLPPVRCTSLLGRRGLAAAPEPARGCSETRHAPARQERGHLASAAPAPGRMGGRPPVGSHLAAHPSADPDRRASRRRPRAGRRGPPGRKGAGPSTGWAAAPSRVRPTGRLPRPGRRSRAANHPVTSMLAPPTASTERAALARRVEANRPRAGGRAPPTGTSTNPSGGATLAIRSGRSADGQAGPLPPSRRRTDGPGQAAEQPTERPGRAPCLKERPDASAARTCRPGTGSRPGGQPAPGAGSWSAATSALARAHRSR
jgi:hypothetical protein